MKKGLVLGKFLPFHKGHIALIDFARRRCEDLTVLICAAESETIPGNIRLGWVREHYREEPAVHPVLLEYDESLLPNTSVSSRRTAQKWAAFLRDKFGHFDAVFTSEKYGDHLAEYLGAVHVSFDAGRKAVPVSATQIRRAPFEFWDYLPAAAQPYFVKKVCLIGTESTGKSTLAEKLAGHYDTVFVPEMAREIIEKTAECRPEHLSRIAELHAETIVNTVSRANKLMFIDTDVNITRSYSRFLFGRELDVPGWIEDANRCDLYLYLGGDSEYVQDGTRLDRTARDRLDAGHRKIFEERNIEYARIDGGPEEKFRAAVDIINSRFTLPG